MIPTCRGWSGNGDAMREKQIDDVTREEWVDFVAAADSLLAWGRFILWVSDGRPSGLEPDGTERYAVVKMVKAFKTIGLAVPSDQEYEGNLESMLASGLHPDHWRALRDCETQPS